MPQCALKSCKNNYRKSNLSVGVSYFRYPCNPFTCAEWISIVARERRDNLYKPSKNSVICSDHFDKADISGNTNRRRLVKNAIPKLQIQPPTEDLQFTTPNTQLSESNTDDVMWSSIQPVTFPSTISEQDETKGNSDYPTDDDDEDSNDEDSDDTKELKNLRKRVAKLEQQSQDYDSKFKEFGEKVVNRLKSLPVKSAVLLQKRLEDVMNEFCSSLTDVQSKILKKGKTLQKGKCPKKKSSSKNIVAPSSSIVTEVIANAPSNQFITDPTNQAFIVSSLAMADQSDVAPASKAKCTKMKSSSKNIVVSSTSSIVTEVLANAPSKQVVTDPYNQTFTISSLAMADQSDVVPACRPQIHKSQDTTGICLSYGINPKSLQKTITATTNKIPGKRPFFEDESSEDKSVQKQTRVEDDDNSSDEIEIKIETEEMVFKTEDEDDDEFDPLKFT